MPETGGTRQLVVKYFDDMLPLIYCLKYLSDGKGTTCMMGTVEKSK